MAGRYNYNYNQTSSWRGTDPSSSFRQNARYYGQRDQSYRRSFGSQPRYNRRYFIYGMDSFAPITQQRDQDRAPEPDPERTLMVKNVDLNIESNGTAHHTAEYDMSSEQQIRPKLVVRRGQSFNLEVQFNRSYNPKKDDLKLIFEAEGATPIKSKGTYVEILLSDADELNKWGAKILSNKGSKLTVTVFTPPTLFVGKWRMSIDVVEKDDTSTNVYKYEHPDSIYFIFNPWCKGDGTYMGNEENLKEYILNESGRIFSGSANQITAKPWNFGQFEAFVLDVALYLLDAGGLKWTVRGNPIAVVRKLTAMVNSSDDNGVLVGNWSGKYEGGRSPLSWTGSPPILKRYWITKQPVRFGQCWVFSGLTTTLMRALGIPARSITNFASAHDTDGSVTIDYHFDSNGEPEEEINEDSIWNFHVWNEVWISRPDLPKGFGGWQAVDATPQEASDGVYVCGPVSVQAIKLGELNMPYDAAFVFAEVNADCMNWYTDEWGIVNPGPLRTNVVGKSISTKACNCGDREDVTNHYKPPEGTAEERSAVMRANQTGSTMGSLYSSNKPEDVQFSVVQDTENTWVGKDFVVSLNIRNNSSSTRTPCGRGVVKTMFYTGVTSDKVKSEPFSDGMPIVIKPGKEHNVKMVVKPGEYVDKLKDCCMLDVTFWAMVMETKQVYSYKESFRLRKPHLNIKAPKETVTGKQFSVELSFVNPLDTTLTECQVEVDGLSKDLSFPQAHVAANGTFSTTVPITASKKGQKELIIIFSSKQLEDINGSHPIFIRAA